MNGQHNSLAVVVTTLSCPIIHSSDTLKTNTSKTDIGTAVEFSCPTGFLLMGERTQVCRDDGKQMNEQAGAELCQAQGQLGLAWLG